MNFLQNQGYIAELGDLGTSAGAEGAPEEQPVPVLRRRHDADRRDRRVGGALRATVERQRLRGLARGAAAGRPGPLAQRERAGQRPRTSSRWSRPTRRWTPSSASRTCAGACTTSSRPRPAQIARLKALELPACRCRASSWLGSRRGPTAAGRAAVRRHRRPAASTPACTGRRAHRAAQPVVRTPLRDHRAQLCRRSRSTPASRSRAAGTARLHARATAWFLTARTSSARSRPASSPTGRARQRLLQRQRRGDEADADRSSRSSAGRSFTTAVNWPRAKRRRRAGRRRKRGGCRHRQSQYEFAQQ